MIKRGDEIIKLTRSRDEITMQDGFKIFTKTQNGLKKVAPAVAGAGVG